MELRIPWEAVAAADGKNVYPAEMHGFRALVKFAGTPDEMGTLTAEVKRTIPVVVFANPDASRRRNGSGNRVKKSGRREERRPAGPPRSRRTPGRRASSSTAQAAEDPVRPR